MWYSLLIPSLSQHHPLRPQVCLIFSFSLCLFHLYCRPKNILYYSKDPNNDITIINFGMWVSYLFPTPWFLHFFFLVEGKLVNQHGITPIVWAWLGQPTKNLPGFQIPPELLIWVRSKENIAFSPLLRAGMPYW